MYDHQQVMTCWASMKRGGCKFGDGKTRAQPGAVHGQNEGAVVSESVPKLKESAPPPPPDHVSITQLSRGHPVLSELYPNVS